MCESFGRGHTGLVSSRLVSTSPEKARGREQALGKPHSTSAQLPQLASDIFPFPPVG